MFAFPQIEKISVSLEITKKQIELCVLISTHSQLCSHGMLLKISFFFFVFVVSFFFQISRNKTRGAMVITKTVRCFFQK